MWPLSKIPPVLSVPDCRYDALCSNCNFRYATTTCHYYRRPARKETMPGMQFALPSAITTLDSTDSKCVGWSVLCNARFGVVFPWVLLHVTTTSTASKLRFVWLCAAVEWSLATTCWRRRQPLIACTSHESSDSRSGGGVRQSPPPGLGCFTQSLVHRTRAVINAPRGDNYCLRDGEIKKHSSMCRGDV